MIPLSIHHAPALGVRVARGQSSAPRGASRPVMAYGFKRNQTPAPIWTTPFLPSKVFQQAAARRPIRQRSSLPYGSQQVVMASTKVEFVIQNEVNYGESMKIVGNVKTFGKWETGKALHMKWNDGHVWTVTVDLEPGEDLEFKCIKASEHDVTWEDGNNRNIKVPSDAESVQIQMEWGRPTKVSADGIDATMESSFEFQESDLLSTGSMDSGDSGDIGDWQDHERWAGRNVEFMQSNQHSKDRQGTWDTEGLEGAALALVEGDSKSGSWLQKLKVLKELMVDRADRMRPELDALVNASAYMLWINTGAIVCVEGGGHYRPNHHAEISRTMFRSLEWVLGDRERTMAEKIVARRVHPRLPSFSAEFTASVPLTRIRDIAHRNDIPHDLKSEIKHTLQNKLHRNAGPEDLIASEQMLQRITRNPGEYNGDFVNEFRIFFEELKDFFNANTLTDMLRDLEPSMENENKTIINNFLNAKHKVDSSNPTPQLQDVMEALHCLTTLRAMLMSGLASGLRNDVPDEGLAMRQVWRLCEIRAEDYGFVLLSCIENSLEMAGGYEALATARDRDWALPIGAAVLGLRHMGLSGWHPAECTALEAELSVWQRQGFFTQKEQALRMKATLERCLRLTEDYASLLLEVYPKRVRTLGNALGVEERLISVYTEAEIRAGVVFQLSKLATLLAKAARVAAGSGAWDVVVSGSVAGKLLEVETFDPAEVAKLAGGEDYIVLVRSATGDEEITGAGNIKGIILQQEIAHLSHLGVRSRQENVVFVTSEQKEIIQGLEGLIGKNVSMEAGADGAKVEELSGSVSKPAPVVEKVAAKVADKVEEVAEKVKQPVVRRLPKGVKVAQTKDAKKDAVLTFSFSEDTEEDMKEAVPAKAASGGSSSNGTGNGASKESSPQGLEYELSSKVEVIPLAEATNKRCGAKAAACGVIAKAAEASAGAFSAPAGAVITFGGMEAAIKEAGNQGRFEELLKTLETAEMGEALDSTCNEMRELVSKTPVPASAISAVANLLPKGTGTIARSSANVEDLAGMSGAGLYDSIPSKGPGDAEDFGNSIAQVWGSLYTRRAVLSRRSAGVPQAKASMAILVMPLLEPETSFVLHTVRPVDKNTGVLYAEVAPGQGETLASGARGTPWRLSVDKKSGEVTTSSFANFSQALVVQSGRLKKKCVNYGEEALSVDVDARAAMGKQLMQVGVTLEKQFGGPQDIEGAYVDGKLYIVQSRPQP